jgi:hypothetical protein
MAINKTFLLETNKINPLKLTPIIKQTNYRS